MGRMWAMGCSASNAQADIASNLSDRAARQAFTREELIRQIMGAPQRDPVTGKMIEHDYDSAAVAADLAQARAALKTYRHDDSPDAERFGAPTPMFVRGEVYQTELVQREADGRIYREGVRRNGPLVSRVRVREELDGGEFTRVVAEAR
jgi:hypothetical protein